jgi:hypothetical protein
MFLPKQLKFLPLFIAVICTTLLVLAMVPGRLEYYLDTYANDRSYLFAVRYFGVPLVWIVLVALGAYEVVKILQCKQNIRQAFSIFSLSILTISKLVLFFALPARINFYTHIQQLERALDRHVTNGNRQNFYFQTRNFVANNSENGVEDQYGFAYLPHPSKTYYQITHIHGKWYIFGGINWTGTPGGNDYHQGE